MRQCLFSFYNSKSLPQVLHSNTRNFLEYRSRYAKFSTNKMEQTMNTSDKSESNVSSKSSLREFPSELFQQSITVVALKVPTTLCSVCTKKLKKHLIEIPKLKPIIHSENDETRLILLKNEIKDAKDLSPEIQEFLTTNQIEITRHQVQLELANWTTEEALRKILPTDVDPPSAFETVGHIAHLNLRDEHQPFKYLIGQIILKKNPSIRTVVTKLGKIESEYRTFQMEVIAGDPAMETQVKESNCVFQFNFSEVYWNSRLQREHDRIIQLLKPADIICDMFAGVGPFAIPAAKKCAQVYANDLNPRSFFYLQKNATLNKIGKNLHCFNLDGREFVRQLVTGQTLPVHFSQVIMNLPALAPEFLDVFRGLFPSKSHFPQLPTIHCYGFSNADDPKLDMVKRIETVLGASITPNTVHEVRDVAPKKFMICVSFPLPASIAYADDLVVPKRPNHSLESEPSSKQQRLN